MIRVLFVFGTRPEAIKLAPVIRKLRSEPYIFEPRICVTAQHRTLLDQVLDVFDLRPDHDLDLMRPDQSLTASTARILAGLEPVLDQERPQVVVVQGDTTTTFCGALAAFLKHVPVAHVEAGLRTGDPGQPFPEEMNRVLVSRLASIHLPATEWAAGNLSKEGIPQHSILVCGNTGIDAVLHVRDRLAEGALQPSVTPEVPAGKRLIVVTLHRRENFGPGLERIAEALRTLASRGDLHIVYPVHPNPNVRTAMRHQLGGTPGITLIEPLDYVSFVALLSRAYLLITDSGGVQEEAPSLGKPLLVLRHKTERPEAVEAGTVRLVGTDTELIVTEAGRLLDDADAYARMARVHNPYGDGQASERIAGRLRQLFG